MDEQLKSNLLSGKHWLRLVYMLLFAVFLQVSSVIMWVLVAVQFLFALITGNDNPNLRRLGSSLSQYIYEALRFLTYNSEEKPFPFNDWPEPEPSSEPPASEAHSASGAYSDGDSQPSTVSASAEARDLNAPNEDIKAKENVADENAEVVAVTAEVVEHNKEEAIKEASQSGFAEASADEIKESAQKEAVEPVDGAKPTQASAQDSEAVIPPHKIDNGSGDSPRP